MSNVLIFHGTEGYPTENWFPWMKKNLEERGYNVIIPHFPSPPVVPAKISEWFDVLEEHMSKIDEDTIIIGHSLGGVFTLRVLEKLDQPIKAAFFTGTPVGERPILYYDRDMAFCGFDFDWEKIRNSARKFEVFHSDTDPFVDLANGEKLSEKLGVKLNFIPNAGHFNKKAGYLDFPQLLEKFNDL